MPWKPRSMCSWGATATRPATGYRNGYGRPREIGIGTWSVEVRPPRVSDLPDGVAPFESALLPRRRYLSLETQWE